ncbi:MAG TPA: hypothetical protein VK171_12700 [Fimbriimonas sp.]|nr:hypothetical protein [Fimbriimonas sp.]
MVNRAAFIVKPAQPYIDWATSVDDSGLIPDPNAECTVYLVPEVSDEDHLEEIVEQIYEYVFDRELYCWHTEEAAWPQNRTLPMFKEWFTYQVHSVIVDLTDDALVDDEAEE